MKGMGTALKQVTVVINCVIMRGKMEVAMQALKTVIKTVMLQEKACRGIRVHQDTDNPQRLLIIENWESKEAFLGPHMQTTHMIAFMKLAESFLDGKAEFNFWNEVLTES